MNVYFISGMCVNCKVFDRISLPLGFEKHYLEWLIPETDESLEFYTRRMAEHIDISSPYIIVGYSLGGIIMQEMNKFLDPQKNILISSVKHRDEIPDLFRLARKIRFGKLFPKRLYIVNKSISNLFTRLVYNMPIDDIERCVTYTSPNYMKWAVHQITNWIPHIECKNLYHIHGSKDQVFPHDKIRNMLTVNKGDHLMIMKRSEEISDLINNIITKNDGFR